MKKKRGNVLIIIGAVLVICAAALASYNLWDDARAGKTAQNALEGLNVSIDQAEEIKGIEGIPLYKANPEIPMPEVEIDGEKYIGKIAVPGLGIELPVISRWNDDRLNIAPCRYKGSIYMDNMILAGHSYASHFRPMRKIKVGEKVYFTDVENNRFSYEVLSVETLKPSQLDVLEREGDWDFTIFTCTPAGQARVVARCVRVGE